MQTFEAVQATSTQETNLSKAAAVRQIRVVLSLFILGLVLSGVTAFPLLRELDLVCNIRGLDSATAAGAVTGFDHWILTVRDGLRESYRQYPWLAYGTDWLGFAHIVIAVFFIGVLVDPVRNMWVLKAGIIACLLVFPLALICGAIRQIPFGWRLIDCSFGAFGIIPLIYCLRIARRLEAERT